MLYRRAIFVDEMRILCRIIGGSHTIKSYSKLTPSFFTISIEVIRICDIITDGLNNVFADVDSIHKTDLLEVRLRVRAAANIPLTDKVAKRPHFWEVLSSLLMNIFAKNKTHAFA